MSWKQADPCHLTNLKKYQSFLRKKPQNKEEFKWYNSEKWKAQQFRRTHTDTQAFPNSSTNKTNFFLGYICDELEHPFAVLPCLTMVFNQTPKSALGLQWTSYMMWSSRGSGRKYTQTHPESLTEVQCIVMKIKDNLIMAPKWYWTSVNAGEGTSKNEDSWTSHKMQSLSACAWGCKRSTRAPDSRTRNGPSLPWTRWLHRENGTNPSHIRPAPPTSPQLLCSTQGSICSCTPWSISIHMGSI